SVRTREYLTTAEIERLMAAARKSSRYGHRDATMILRACRCLLQQAWDVRAVDQGRQRRDQVDAAVVPDVCRKCSAASAACACLQPRQLPAHAGDAGTYA